MSSSYKKFMTEMDRKMYNMGKNLIIEVCDRLNKSNKADGLINDLLQKTNKVKGGSKPKRPKTSYQLFLDDVRSKVMKKYPSDNIGQITKKCAKLWGKLKEKDKKKYIEMAEEKKIKYETETLQSSNNILTTDTNIQNDLYDNSSSEYDSDESTNSSEETESSSNSSRSSNSISLNSS